MVTYLDSFATKTIQVLTAEVGTMLTISAPAAVVQGQPFRTEGTLKRVDTGALLEEENISLSYNGILLTTTRTRYIEGTIKYQADVQIDEMGSFTLRADFAGSTRSGFILTPSQAPRGISIIGLDIPSLIIGVVAPAVVGGTIAYLSK